MKYPPNNNKIVVFDDEKQTALKKARDRDWEDIIPVKSDVSLESKNEDLLLLVLIFRLQMMRF